MSVSPDAELQGPALTLPHELASKIFINTLPSHRRVRPGRKRAPLQLAQVCSQWRAVALGTPELWSSIYFEFPTGGTYDGLPILFGLPDAEPVVDHTGELLELWLTRAANHTVSVTLICTDRNICLPKNMLSILSAHSAHWGRIELNVMHQDFKNFNKIPGPSPLLRSLAISFTDYLPIDYPISSIRRSPNLTALYFGDPINQGVLLPDLAALPASLTALQMCDATPGPHVNFFRQFERFPGLLHLSSLDDYTTVPGPPRVVPYLQSLILSASPRLLDHLEIPTLKYLEVGLVPGGQRIAQLTGFLSRSASHLTHLRVDVRFSGLYDLVPCLSAAISLVMLEFTFSDVAVAGSNTRYPFLPPTGVLPHLRMLKITDALYPGTEMTYVSFLVLLRTQRALTHSELHMRPRHVAARRRIALPGRDLLEGFEALAAEGMSIHITTPNSAWPDYMQLEDPDAIANPENAIDGYKREFFAAY
ncbi:hypothetical protein DFH09DRAFT_1369627 [Mycena vulgaris]|nr:hypothetical protein DFH09DRAFT_1369627 [Mycena vulgaris]